MTSLLTNIERHLKSTSISPSRFGREAARDPRFVFDLRRGREPRARTEARVVAFIAARSADGIARSVANVARSTVSA